MRRCLRVVAAAAVLLPAVDAFCTLAARHSIYRTPRCSSSSSADQDQTRGYCGLSTRRSVALTMQGGAGYGGGQSQGEDGYASNPGASKPAWNPQRSFSDGFHEGIPRLNTVFLTGYLGQDPKPKYFDNGKVVLNLSLAVKREYHPIERKALGVVYGEEETDWFQLEMWNRDAEFAAKVCKKGGRVGVTGGLSLNAWVDREGRDRTTARILVQNLELLDSRAEQAERSDRSDANLWESERLQKSDAAALRQQGGGGMGGASGGAALGGGAYQQQSAEELEAKARKKAAEDKWWSAEPEAGGGGGGATAGTGRESSWWEEDGGGGAASKGIDADSLPSFFDS